MKKKSFIIVFLSTLLITSCSPKPAPEPVPTITQQPTMTVTNALIKTNTPEPTITPTPEPYDLSNLSFPMDTNDVILFKANFNCLTDYGDMTHDGNDIEVPAYQNVPVLAVDDGIIVNSNWVNDSVGYEIILEIGKDSSFLPIKIHYVHLSESLVNNGQYIQKGDIIGYINEPLGGGPHLHIEMRVGTQPRMETESDGAPGDEVDITDNLIQFLPENKIYYMNCN